MSNVDNYCKYNCDSTPSSTTPRLSCNSYDSQAVADATRKRINKRVRVPASLYTMNLGAKTASGIDTSDNWNKDKKHASYDRYLARKKTMSSRNPCNCSYTATFGSITPADNGFINSINSTVSYTLIEDITSGSVTYTRVGGTQDTNSPHNLTLRGNQLKSGTTIQLSVPDTLVDGAIYDISFSGTNAGGNTGSNVVNNITFDTTAPTFDSIIPATGADVYNSTVSYKLSKDITSGSVTYTRVDGTHNQNTQHLSGNELKSGTTTLSNPVTLVDGAIYDISFSGTDAAGNTGSDEVKHITFNIDVTTLSWNSKGFIINGESSGDYFGLSVSSSSDGNIIAVGAKKNDGHGAFSNHGHVRVFEWRQYTNTDGDVYHYSSSSNSSKPLIVTNSFTAPVPNTNYWSQKGLDIDGPTVPPYNVSNNFFGHSVSLSSDGLKLAVGANLAGSDDRGLVRVFQFNTGSWSQIGQDLTGVDIDDKAGETVSLSNDGYTVAIGAKSLYNNNKGIVKVYEYQSNQWVQKGADIPGENNNDLSGSALRLSSDGSIVAIGAKDAVSQGGNKGHVRVYEWRQYTTSDPNNHIITGGSTLTHGTDYWTQKGFDIDGEISNDFFGASNTLDISSDGLTLIVGAPHNTSNSGHARVFEWRQYTSADSATYHHSSSTQRAPSQPKPLIITGGSAPENDTYYWTQKGFDIDGEGTNESSRTAMNDDGTIIAIGGGSHTRLFKWRRYTSADNDSFYYASVQQNNTQTKPLIITGSFSTQPQNDQYYWTQIGADLEGKSHSVSLSDDGKLVTVGDNVGNNTKVYELQ